MDYGSGYLTIVLVYFVLWFLWDISCDEDFWKSPDISKPDIGHDGGDNGFMWSLMLNKEE